MWEKKVAGGGCLHCVDDTYNWNTATGAWIAAVNAEGGTGFASHIDWRVPTLDELAGLLLEPYPCDDRNPCIDPIFDPTAAALYWSATEADPAFAWDVFFSLGNLFSDFKIATFRVRAVRGGP
jgi:hypothetical protein